MKEEFPRKSPQKNTGGFGFEGIFSVQARASSQKIRCSFCLKRFLKYLVTRGNRGKRHDAAEGKPAAKARNRIIAFQADLE